MRQSPLFWPCDLLFSPQASCLFPLPSIICNFSSFLRDPSRQAEPEHDVGMLLRLLLLLPMLWGGKWAEGIGVPAWRRPRSSGLNFCLSPGLLTQHWGYQLDLQESMTV